MRYFDPAFFLLFLIFQSRTCPTSVNIGRRFLCKVKKKRAKNKMHLVMQVLGRVFGGCACLYARLFQNCCIKIFESKLLHQDHFDETLFRN